MSVVSASWRTHARARIRTPHVNTGRKREKKGEESTEVHASPPSLYRCCYVTGLRRLELTTIPPPLSRRGSVNSTKLTRRSPVFATSRRTGRDPRIATRCIRLLGRDSDRGGLLLLLLARNIFVSASGNWMTMMMCRAFVASIVSIGEYRKEDDRDMDYGIEVRRRTIRGLMWIIYTEGWRRSGWTGCEISDEKLVGESSSSCR